jgi:aarF domain-containing kinase
MEFCHGVKVNDINGIKAMHLDPNDVAKVVLDNFSEQIYLHGFIHSDPHPGNILVLLSEYHNLPKTTA